LWIASFWNPTQPFRFADACGFQLIICIPTNSALERSLNAGGIMEPQNRQPLERIA
jgi:hypothetical protein